MKNTFNSDFFTHNRKRLVESLNTDAPIVVVGNGTMQRNRDNSFPFRQNSNFWYLTGVEEPDAWLLIYKNESFIVTADDDFVHAYFEGAVNDEAIVASSGADYVMRQKQAWPHLRKILQKHSTLAMNVPDPIFDSMHRIYTNPAQSRFKQKIKRAKPDVKLIDVRKELMDLRWVKQAPEIAALQHAIDETCSALQHVQQNINAYKNESHIEADLTHSFAMKQMRHAYYPIVGAGIRSCTLHYSDNNQPINGGEVVLIDVGAEYSNYAADITRTFVKGSASDLQRQVLLAVTRASDYMVSLIHPGAIFYDILLETEQFIGRELKTLGLIDDPTKREQIHEYFPHASHYLGLDVHDVGDYRKPLVPGVVLTAEPGIYIPSKSVGVRIEDDILVTEEGCRVLSKNLPKHFVVD